MAEVIYLQNVRLSFPHLVEPHASAPNAPAKYSADFIMDPAHAGFAEFRQRYAELAQGKWAEQAQQIMQMIQADRKLRCYCDGSERVNRKTLQVYEGYVGMVAIGASRDQKYQLIKADGNPVDSANTMEWQQLARTLYAGCRVNVAIRPWLQDNQHGRAIRCDLVAIQFASDDTPFGEGETDASGMFGAAQQAVAPSPTGS